MHTTYAREVPKTRTRRLAARAQIVSLIGPATIAAGVVWGILQPDRVTLLSPRGQSFWWLVLEPPVLVAIAGAIFVIVVARPLLSDLEEHDAPR